MIICMQFRQNLRCRVLWLGRSVMECPSSGMKWCVSLSQERTWPRTGRNWLTDVKFSQMRHASNRGIRASLDSWTKTSTAEPQKIHSGSRKIRRTVFGMSSKRILTVFGALRRSDRPRDVVPCSNYLILSTENSAETWTVMSSAYCFQLRRETRQW